MGLCTGTQAQLQAWEDAKKSSGNKSNLVEARVCDLCSFFGGCLPSNANDAKSSSTGSSITGSNLSKACTTPPSEQCFPSDVLTKSDASPSEQCFQSDVSAKSDAPPSEQCFPSTTSDDLKLSVLSTPEEPPALGSQLRRFSFSDLKAATRNFRPDSLLGEGGFGCVFKGWIDEHGTAAVKPGTGLTVAVKALNHSGLQGHKEWLAELTYLGQFHHPNLVNLIGFCIEDDQRLLVYEFLQRGSLENHLFRKGALPLPWSTRLKIALGAAKGVEFLHSSKNPVIYRDFKTSNILLDVEYRAKLSDFGLAKDGPQGDKTHVSTRVMGTYGYAAPEYIMTGHLSTKSDVYSFGVVLLEMLTGKRSMDKNRPNGEHNLAIWARPFLSDQKKLFKIVDPRLEGHYSRRGVQKAGQLAYRCLSRDPRNRPSMSNIVEVLEQLQGLTDMASAVHLNVGGVPLASVGGAIHHQPSKRVPVVGPRKQASKGS